LSKVLHQVQLAGPPLVVDPRRYEDVGGTLVSIDPQEAARRVLDRARGEAEQIRLESETQARIRLQTVDEKVSKTLAETREKGYREGLDQARQEVRESVEADLARLGELIESLLEERIRALREQEKDIIALAVTLTERLVHGQVKIDPDIICRTAREAIEMATEKEEITVRLHPDDLQVLREHAEDLRMRFRSVRNIRIEEDPRIYRGGCIVETKSGYVDATLDGQIAEAATELGLSVDFPEETSGQ